MTLRRALSLVLVVLAVIGAVSACGSDSDSDGASSAPTNETGPCPFSGSTKAQELAGEPAPATLTSATPQTDGCIDNVQLKFSPALAASKFAYQADAPVLVVTLSNTTLGGGLETGTTQNPENLNHVQQVEVSTPGGNVQVAITLDEKRPFDVSSSGVPAEIELSIG
jgi:AMIN domain